MYTRLSADRVMMCVRIPALCAFFFFALDLLQIFVGFCFPAVSFNRCECECVIVLPDVSDHVDVFLANRLIRNSRRKTTGMFLSNTKDAVLPTMPEETLVLV